MSEDWERARISRDSRQSRRHHPPRGGSPAFVGQVTSNSNNIGVGKYLMVLPVTLFGNEAEGAPWNSTNEKNHVPAYLVGPDLPRKGDFVVVEYEGNRWVIEFFETYGDGSGYFGSIPFCVCQQTPIVLTMTSADESLRCNQSMFRTGVIAWSDPPAGFEALRLGTKGYFGTAFWPDPVTINNAFGGWYDANDKFHPEPATFCYMLTCQGNEWDLARLYVDSPYGSPYRDGVLWRWLIGGLGNTCVPFRLTNGFGFPGSGLSCNVTLTG